MALKTNQLAHYDCEETSGNLLDSVGSNNFTDVNTCGTRAGNEGQARDLIAANSETFSLADNADFSIGDVDFCGCVGVKLDNNDSKTILCKWNSGASSREYLLDFLNGTSKFRWSVSGDGSGQTTLSATDTYTTSTWYLLFFLHDATNNVIKLRVNAGTTASAAHTTGIFSGTANTYIGSFNGSSGYFDGAIDFIHFRKGSLWTEAEMDEIYNSGTWKPYVNWDASITPGTLSLTSASATSISLSTTAATGTGTINYQLQRTTDLTGATGWTDIGSAGTGTTFTDSTVSGGTTYLFRVKITDDLSTAYTNSIQQTAEGVVSFNLGATGVIQVGRTSDASSKRTMNSNNGGWLFSFTGRVCKLWYTAGTTAPVWVSIDGGAWSAPSVFSNTGTLTKSGDITGGALSEGSHDVHIRIKDGQTGSFSIQITGGIEITSDATPAITYHSDLAAFEYTRGTHAGLYWSDTFRGSLLGTTGFSSPIYPGAMEASGVCAARNVYCEFLVDAATTKVWFFTKTETRKQFSIWVDDVRYTDFRTGDTTNGTHGLIGPFSIAGSGQRKIRVSDLLSLDGVGVDGAFVTTAVQQPTIVVVWLGDSVVSGDSAYVSTTSDEIDDAPDASGNFDHLSQILLQNHKSYNRGKSGDTAALVTSAGRVAADIDPLSPDLVICNLGINDSAAWVSSEAATRAQYVTVFNAILAGSSCHLAVVPQFPSSSTNRTAIVAGLQAAVADVANPRCVYYSSDAFVASTANKAGAHPKDIGKAEGTGYGLVMAKITSQPSDGDTITITGTSGAIVFEFDSNATVTGGRTAVTIGGSLVATITNLAAAIAAAGASFSLFERVLLTSDTGQQGVVIRNASAIAKSGTNIEVYGPNPGWADTVLVLISKTRPMARSRNLLLLGAG